MLYMSDKSMERRDGRMDGWTNERTSPVTEAEQQSGVSYLGTLQNYRIEPASALACILGRMGIDMSNSAYRHGSSCLDGRIDGRWGVDGNGSFYFRTLERLKKGFASCRWGEGGGEEDPPVQLKKRSKRGPLCTLCRYYLWCRYVPRLCKYLPTQESIHTIRG